MTDAPRPLDDLTRDLRARTIISKTGESGLFFQDDKAATNASFSVEHKRDPLSLEAADAIDHLRADLTRFHDAAMSRAVSATTHSSSDSGELPRPNGRNQMWPTPSDAQRAGTMRSVYEAAVGPRLAAKIVDGDPLPEENDAVASLAPLTAEDGVRRWRRRIDLDGGKYSIFLAETFPPDFDLPGEPKHLPVAFLSNGESWEGYFLHSGFVHALAEALWARAYATPTAPDVAPPGPTERTVAIAFEQLEKCRYACEGGPLENDAAYRWLKREIAAETIKNALDALRSILINHRIETFFRVGKRGVCFCGSSFSDSSGWVDHVLEVLALGTDPKDLRAFEDDGIVSRAPSNSAWRSVPLTAGLLFDALGRTDVERGDGFFSLSCEVERAGRSIVEGKS